MALRSLQSCSNLAEWQTRVHRLWSFRKQHWDVFQKDKYNPPPKVPHASYTSRSASEWRPHLESNVKSVDRFKPKPPYGLVCSARELKPTCSPFSSARSQPKRPSSSFFNSVRSQSKPSSPLYNSGRSQSKATTSFYKPSAWKEDIVPVPLGLATQTQSQLLVGLISRGSGAFLEQLQRPHKGYPNPELLKLGPRLSGFGSSRLLPTSQAAMEDRIAKEQLKHRAPIVSPNVAFGRSNYASCLSRNNVRTPRKSVSQGKYSTSEPASAKREVINKIQTYHINADDRARLTKQAVSARQERRVSVSARSSRRESLL